MIELVLAPDTRSLALLRRRQVAVPSPAASIASIDVGALSNGQLPITITATGAQAGDGIYAVLIPSADTPPSATEVRALQASGGSSPTQSASAVWPGAFTETLVDGIARGNYILYCVIDNGEISDVGSTAPFLVDTVAPILVAPAGNGGPDLSNLSVTSNEGTGAIYAASRLAATPAQDVATIVANGVTAAASAGPNALPNIAGLADGDYAVDFVQIDDFGNPSSIVSTGALTVAANTYIYQADFTTFPNGPITNTDANFAQNRGTNIWQVSSGAAFSVGSFDGVRYEGIPPSPDYRVYGVVGALGSGTEFHSIWTRITGPDDFDLFYIRANGDYAIGNRISGTTTSNAGTTTPLTIGDEISVEHVGDQIRGYVNNVLIATFTVSGGASAGNQSGYPGGQLHGGAGYSGLLVEDLGA